MSTEKFAEALGRLADRRTFLQKLGGASLGAVLLSLGLPSVALAYQYQCCGLCAVPQPCSPSCWWCWTCCSGNQPFHRFQCCEGYSSSTCPTGSGGGSWICSSARDIGNQGCCPDC